MSDRPPAPTPRYATDEEIRERLRLLLRWAERAARRVKEDA